jgi:hypothetical protein
MESGAAEEELESFIVNISYSDIPPKEVIQCVNQLYGISKEQSIPLPEVPGYIEKKLEEKRKIDEDA